MNSRTSHTRRAALLARRVLIWLCGMVVLAFGIVLCSRCGLGVTPITTIPYSLARCLPLSFGTLTSLHHLANVIVQYVLEKRLWNPRILLQLPECVIFGMLVDVVDALIGWAPTHLAVQVALMVGSIVLIATGTFLMVGMDLIANPPDSCVHLISELVHGDMGVVKRTYDITMVAITLVIDLVVYNDFYGLGIASIVSMFGVGWLLTQLNRLFGRQIDALRNAS